MEKRKLIALLLPLILVSCSQVDVLNDSKKELARQQAEVSSTVNETFYNFLTGSYSMTTTLNSPYLSGSIDVEMLDEVYQSGTNPVHHSKYSLYLTTSSYNHEYVTGNEYYYTKDSDGYTVEQYLTLDNKVSTREVTDSASSKVLYDGNKNSPFAKLSGKKSSLSTYFDIEAINDGYVYTLTDAGKVLLTTSFNNFFPSISSTYLYNFDSHTHETSMGSMFIVTDSTGKPTKMNYSRIESDFYGAVKDDYVSVFSTLDSSPYLTSVTSSLTDEQATSFDEKLQSIKTSIAFGNFTQHITVNSHTYDTDGTTIIDYVYDYYNYYDLSSSYGSGSLMELSSLLLQDSSYGDTYIGLAYDETYQGYYYLAISPDSSYYAALESSTYYSDLSDLIPSVAISSDFFTYSSDGEKSVYTFDLKNKIFNDYEFSLSILEAFLSDTDPATRYGLLLGNSSTYEFDFSNLVITYDDSTFEVKLNFTDAYGKDASLITTYSDFNTTNILKTGNEGIDACITVMEQNS